MFIQTYHGPKKNYLLFERVLVATGEELGFKSEEELGNVFPFTAEGLAVLGIKRALGRNTAGLPGGPGQQSLVFCLLLSLLTIITVAPTMMKMKMTSPTTMTMIILSV